MARLNTSAEVLHDLRKVGYDSTGDVVIGETTPDGFSLESNTDETTLKAGTRRDAYLYIPGSTEKTFTFNLVDFSMENLAAAFGQHEADITGAGTVGSPYLLTLNPTTYAEQTARTWFAEGLREDGQIVRAEFASTKVYCPQVTIKVTTGEPTSIPFKLRVMGNISIKLWTPA